MRFRAITRIRSGSYSGPHHDAVVRTKHRRRNFLLFAPQAIDFDAVAFNTEAHPLRAPPAKK
jgi:hypothetical protein